jgi:DNA modification methylase
MLDRITEQPFCQNRVMRSVLVNADCLEYLPTLESKSVDFVCIDPPYELDNHGGVVNGHELTRKLNRDKHINFISDGFDLDAVFSQIERVSKVM